MAECGVCWENFEKEGAKCPKLLPCIHTFCLSCLKTLAEDGEIQCPYCRTLHQIPSEHIKNLPTNHGILKQEGNKIYTLPSSRVPPQIDGGIGICELHAKPAVSITYNMADGTCRRYCETCLDPDSYIVSEQDSVVQAEEEPSYSFPPSTTTGEFWGNSWSGNLTNYVGRNEPGAPTRPGAGHNMEQALSSCQHSNKRRLLKILKRLAFILSSPAIISGFILITVVVMPIGFILAPCLWEQFVEPFIKYAYDGYACLILTLLCCNNEEHDNQIISTLCRGVGKIVLYMVLALFTIAVIGLNLMPFYAASL